MRSGDEITALNDDGLDVVIVGAGLQGVLAARRLTGEGLKVIVFERQLGIGGIWASHANATSRAQNHEPAYRMGYTQAEEDYTHRDGLIAELQRGAVAAGVADRIFCGVEVVQAAEEGGGVRVSFRPSTPARAGPGPAGHVRAGEVLFCTGTLQRPRRVALSGERAFGGPVVYGLGSCAETLELEGKAVAVLGMGAFAIENARMALFAGAARVELVVRHKLVVLTRLARVLAIESHVDYSSHRDRALRSAGPPHALDPSALLMPPYIAAGAETAMPNAWLRAIEAGHTPDVWRSDSATNLSTSDIFFIALALGRLEVHAGKVSHLESGHIVVNQGNRGTRRLQADVVIKNFGFESPDPGDRMGGVCDVASHHTCRPPIWITPRVLSFRHCTEVARMSQADWGHADELFNFVGSGTFASAAYLEIYLHFRGRPADLQRLLASADLPCKPLSETTMLDMSRGLQAALSFDPALREKVDARRRAINEDTWRRYAPPGTPEGMQREAWVAGFLWQNRADWEQACRQLTGNPHAVPYIWASFERGGLMSGEAPLRSAL